MPRTWPSRRKTCGATATRFKSSTIHIRTIQRLKEHQGLPLAVDLPRVGYLRLPEYWGEVDSNGPSMRRL